MTKNESTREGMSLLEHLDELLLRVRKAVMWAFIGALIGYAFNTQIIMWLQVPYVERVVEGQTHLIFTTPFEQIITYMKVSVIVGMIAFSPLIGYEVAAFVGPGLKAQEKKKILYLLMWVVVCLVGGVFLGYYFFLPAILDQILAVDRMSAAERPFLTLSSYINLALGLLVVSGIFLLIPVIMIHLSLWGWVDAKVWNKSRKMVIVINAFIAALLSPPDIPSMFIFMLPIHLLYEAGSLGARMAQWLNAKSLSSK